MRAIGRVACYSAIIFCICSCFFLCGWADPASNDTYTGYLIYADSQGLPVTHLSGAVTYLLDDYSSLGYSDYGTYFLFNNSGYQIPGQIRVGSTVYNCRMAAFGGLEIQQSYQSGNITRSAWITYNLMCDSLPSGLSIVEISLIFITIICLMVLCVSILQRGVIG